MPPQNSQRLTDKRVTSENSDAFQETPQRFGLRVVVSGVRGGWKVAIF
jgi:hypothetical protein